MALGYGLQTLTVRGQAHPSATNMITHNEEISNYLIGVYTTYI